MLIHAPKWRHSLLVLCGVRSWLVALLLVCGPLVVSAFAQQLPPAAARQFRQALEHMRTERYLLAEQGLSQLERQFPDHADIQQALAMVLAVQGKYVEAIAVFERLRERNPESYEVAYYLAVAYQAAGDFEKARAEAQKALRQWQTADLHHLLGQVNEELKNYLEAVQHFQRAAELEPSERNIYDLGYEFLVHWTWDAALAVFQKGVELSPKSERLWLGLATVYYAQGDYNQATQSILEATAVVPDNMRAYDLLAAAYPLSHGHTEAVQQRLRQFWHQQPDNPWANYYYGLTRGKPPDRHPSKAELAEAIRLLQRATALKPDLAEAHYQLGVLFSEQRQWQQAVPALEAAVRWKPDYVAAHYRLALAYRRTGKPDQAQAMLARYQKLKAEQDSAVERRTAQTTKFIYSLKP